MRFPVSLVLVLLLSGCAHNVKDPTSDASSPYAPSNASSYGVVKYRSGTLVDKSSRENALKMMFEKCNGKYEIIDESISPFGIMPADQFVFIKYRCSK